MSRTYRVVYKPHTPFRDRRVRIKNFDECIQHISFGRLQYRCDPLWPRLIEKAFCFLKRYKGKDVDVAYSAFVREGYKRRISFYGYYSPYESFLFLIDQNRGKVDENKTLRFFDNESGTYK